MEYKISPSLMCMSLIDIKQQLEVLNRRADMLHIDIMDGHYVKNITLSPFFIEQIRPHTPLVLDVHMMVENPADFIEPIALAARWVKKSAWCSTPRHRWNTSSTTFICWIKSP